MKRKLPRIILPVLLVILLFLPGCDVISIVFDVLIGEIKQGIMDQLNPLNWLKSNPALVQPSGGWGSPQAGTPTSTGAAETSAVTGALVFLWLIANGAIPDIFGIADFLRIAEDSEGVAEASQSGMATEAGSGGEESTVTGPKSEQTTGQTTSSETGLETPDSRPAWSLANRPSPDHRWNPETGRWELIEEMRNRDMAEQGYIFDGTDWVKPQVSVKPIKNTALRMQSDPTVSGDVNESWARSEKAPDAVENESAVTSILESLLPFPRTDLAATQAPLVAAVNEYNYQRARMVKLDELFENARKDFRQVDEAIEKARAEGNSGIQAYLDQQHQIATNNMRVIMIARDNCVERMNESADRILTRGTGGAMEAGREATTDLIGISRSTVTTGRLTSNLLNQASRGNLPGQAGAFQGGGGVSPTAGGGTNALGSTAEPGLPVIKLRRGDSLVNEPTFRYSRPNPDAVTPDPSLPVIKLNLATPDRILSVRSNVGVYNGRFVEYRSLPDGMRGVSDSGRPDTIYIDPSQVRKEADTLGISRSSMDTLIKQHETNHQEYQLHTFKYRDVATGGIAIQPVKGLPHNETLLEAQSYANKIQVETAVHQRLRADYQAGKMPNVTGEEWRRYEADHFERINDWAKIREAYMKAYQDQVKNLAQAKG